MTREETSKVVRVLSIAFPTFLRDKQQTEISEIIDLWCLMFADYEYVEVNAALKTFIATNKYPPKIAEVLNCLNLNRSFATEELNELTAWNLVYKAISDSNYHSQERYDELPNLIKKCIHSPAELREMGNLDLKTLNSVTQSNFMRVFKGVQDRERELAKIPKDVKRDMLEMKNNEQLEENSNKLIGG